MPTGYTYPVCEDDQSFEGFVWHCAQAFFHDPPQPLLLTERWPWENSDSYHAQQLDRNQTRLSELQRMTEKKWAAKQEKENAAAISFHKECREKDARENKKLLKMLNRVEAWEPPTPEHAPLKQYMISQLMDSLHPMDEYKPMGYNKRSLADEIERTQKDIEYHTTELAEDNKRCRERYEWIMALHRQIPQPSAKEILGR